MMWGWDGWNWLGWTVMIVSMIILWGAVAWGIMILAGRGGHGRSERRPDPEQVLAERFAAGQIDEEEYRSRLRTLRSTDERASR